MILLLFVFFNSIAQDFEERDTTYISSFSDKIIIKLNLDSLGDIYYIDDNTDAPDLELAENTNIKVNFSLDYDFLGFSFGFAPDFIKNKEDHRKGNSSYRDYEFSFYLGKWVQKVKYNNIRGFYVQNTGDFISDWIEEKDAYILFPNRKIIQWGGGTSYVFNSNFSLRNLIDQTRVQTKSLGSFITTFDYQYQRFSNIVSEKKSVENSYDIQFELSYYYTWVIHKRWLLSSFLSPSLGYRFLNYQENVALGIISKDQYLLKGIDLGIQLGYNSDKLFFGFSGTLDSLSFTDKNSSSITNNRGYAQLYLGYRFNEFKFLRKSVNWMKSKF